MTITWTINGIAQPDDSTNTFHYTYIKLGNLPQAGGKWNSSASPVWTYPDDLYPDCTSLCEKK